MKHLVTLFAACLLASLAHSQNFTWVHGTTATATLAGVYGTMGVPAAANHPGSRHGCAKWTDASGNLWLFGGEGYDGTGTYGWLSDLWKYNPSIDQWTWINGPTLNNQTAVFGTQGVYSASNRPGAREFAASWTDNAGHFWLFGGDGYVATTNLFGKIGDMWEYDPATNQWAWISGFNVGGQPGQYGMMGTPSATTLPGVRASATAWTDAAGDLWLFSGRGLDGGGYLDLLNDLWRYNIASNQWTWVNGSNSISQHGNYGTQLVAAPTNSPGAREFANTWVSGSGNVYLFGGDGYDANLSTPYGYLSDLWKYDPTANAWTWMKGSSSVNQFGTYGTMALESASTLPGARYSAAAWKDDTGDLWLFGGNGYATNNTIGDLNDMFRYNTCTNNWTWMKGANIVSQPGTYGTQGTPASANVPGGREYNTYWKGKGNTLWLFGGIGLGSATVTSYESTDDLWRFDPPCYHSNVNGSGIICSGSTATLSLPDLCEGQVLWYTSPTGTNSIGSGNNFTTTLLAATSQSVYTLYAEAASCTVSPRGAASITVNAAPALSVSPSSLCYGISSTLTASGASSYTWDTGLVGSSELVQTTQPFYTYTVQGIGANGCSSILSNTLTVIALPTITTVASSTMVCGGNSATLTAGGALTYSWSNNATGSVIVVAPTQPVFYTVIGTDASGCQNSAFISLIAGPSPTIQVNTPNLCEGNQATLTVSGANTYSWSQGAVTPSVVFTPTGTAPYSYTVQGTDMNGCTSTIANSLTVHSSPALTAGSSHSLNFCPYNTATLTVSGAVSYVWSNNHTGASIAVSPMQTTSYTVTGTDAFGCVSTAVITQTVSACVGIQTIAAENNQVILYPNPGNGNFTLSIKDADESQLIIYTTLGQKIFEHRLKQGDNFIQSNLAGGLYYYEVHSTGKRLSTGRIVVE